MFASARSAFVTIGLIVPPRHRSGHEHDQHEPLEAQTAPVDGITSADAKRFWPWVSEKLLKVFYRIAEQPQAVAFLGQALASPARMLCRQYMAFRMRH